MAGGPELSSSGSLKKSESIKTKGSFKEKKASVKITGRRNSHSFKSSKTTKARAPDEEEKKEEEHEEEDSPQKPNSTFNRTHTFSGIGELVPRQVAAVYLNDLQVRARNTLLRRGLENLAHHVLPRLPHNVSFCITYLCPNLHPSRTECWLYMRSGNLLAYADDIPRDSRFLT